MSEVAHIADPGKMINVKKLQKPIHIAKHVYKKRKKVNRSTVKESFTIEPHPLFTKFSIMDDIERHSHSSTCCHAVIGKRVICHQNGH